METYFSTKIISFVVNETIHAYDMQHIYLQKYEGNLVHINILTPSNFKRSYYLHLH